ncbi:MAG: ribbon-helix-helix domain-containing protein [Hyphomicrobiaceae bacterium]
MPNISFRIRDELIAPLAEVAKALDRSKSWIINRALTEYFENMGKRISASNHEKSPAMIDASKIPVFELDVDLT